MSTILMDRDNELKVRTMAADVMVCVAAAIGDMSELKTRAYCLINNADYAWFEIRCSERYISLVDRELGTIKYMYDKEKKYAEFEVKRAFGIIRIRVHENGFDFLCCDGWSGLREQICEVYRVKFANMGE